MTLDEYLKELEAKGVNLVTDPAYWRSQGIDTASKLGDYLDIECARNVYKSNYGIGAPRMNAGEARTYLEETKAHEAKHG